MANQMIMPKINLLKLPDPAAQTAKFVNMMNMTRQQEAAELQATRAQQEMDYATAEEGRRKDLHEPAMTKARADNIRAIVADLTEQYKLVDSDAGHQMWLRRLEKADPETAAQVKVAVPEYNPDKIFSIMLKAKEYADKLVADATSSLEIADEGGVDAQGNRIPKGTPVQVTRGLRPNTQVIRSADAPMGAPRTPTAAPQAASANPFAPGYKPNSAAAPVNSLSLVVDSALETGVMAKSDFDKLVRIAQPGTGPKLEAWARQNNITIAPDAPGVTDNQMRGAAADFEMSPMAANPVQTPQSQFAVYRGDPMQSQTAGLDGAPPMQNTMAQYQPIQRRDPNVSPYPGSAQVPIERVRAEGAAGRASPAETAAVETAKIGAQTKAKIAEEERVKTKGRKLFSAALNDMRSDYNTLNKLRAIPSTGRPMLDNMGDYIGASRVGRIVQNAVGSKASVALNNIANSRLTLLNALKEVTNMSAAQLSSNVELMTFLDSLADPTQGYESAMETIRRLENLYGMPAAAQGKRRTPVVASGWGQAKVVGN